jgi:hypothetical protein
MKTQQAIDHAGSAKALADLLGITPGAVSQWGDQVPEGRCWQLRVLKPEWFEPSSSKSKPSKAVTRKNEHPHGAR